MGECNFEEVAAEQLEFDGADLTGSLWTGSTLTEATFANANLTNAGLAEIEWEGADLRDADLRGASFHLGSSRSGLVGSPIAREGSMTGFYTDDFAEQEFKSPEEIRKAELARARTLARGEHRGSRLLPRRPARRQVRREAGRPFSGVPGDPADARLRPIASRLLGARHRPDADASVSSAGHDLLAVADHDHGRDPLRSRGESMDFLAGSDVPDTDVAVVARREEAIAERE